MEIAQLDNNTYNITRTLRKCIVPPRHIIVNKWADSMFFLYPDDDTDHSQHLMEYTGGCAILSVAMNFLRVWSNVYRVS